MMKKQGKGCTANSFKFNHWLCSPTFILSLLIDYVVPESGEELDGFSFILFPLI